MARIKDHESIVVESLKEKLMEENRLLREKLFARMSWKRKILIELAAIVFAFLLVLQFWLTICAVKDQFGKPSPHSSRLN